MMCEMFGTFTHSVFNHDIRIEPLSFYGCYDNLSKNVVDANTQTPVGENDVDNSSDCLENEQETDMVKKKDTSQECKVCGKILSSPSSYYVHMKQHSDSKPYQCPNCDASFCRKPYLEVHKRTHTGEKPFECSECKKRFTQKSSLNTHKRCHTGERPYMCEVCSKSFAVKSYLQAHQWSHMKGSSIPCAECHQTFTTKSQYMTHVRTHNVTKVYECTFCKRNFVKHSYLIRHMNKVHNDAIAKHGKTVPHENDVNIVQLSRPPVLG